MWLRRKKSENAQDLKPKMIKHMSCEPDKCDTIKVRIQQIVSLARRTSCEVDMLEGRDAMMILERTHRLHTWRQKEWSMNV